MFVLSLLNIFSKSLVNMLATSEAVGQATKKHIGKTNEEDEDVGDLSGEHNSSKCRCFHQKMLVEPI